MTAGIDEPSEPGADPRTEIASAPLRKPTFTTGMDRDQPRSSLAGEKRAKTSVAPWVWRMLGAPLRVKLAGANAVLLILAAAGAMFIRSHQISTASALAVIGAAFLAALLIDVALMHAAVRPIIMLEQTVDAIWHGDLEARVPASFLADRHFARVGQMFNVLLDGLVADRARTRRLAVELITAGDRERASIARQLLDSTAQSLAALVMQLSAALPRAKNGSAEILEQRLDDARILASTTLEEVRRLAHALHPRVLDDLGLVAALRRLARESATQSGAFGNANVFVIAGDGIDAAMSAETASVLYRVAQEAILNACRHAGAERIEIRIRTGANRAILEVIDDGVGFDPDAVQSKLTGIGLFTMRERVALIDGALHVTRRSDGGTSVVASVPLPASTERSQWPYIGE